MKFCSHVLIMALAIAFLVHKTTEAVGNNGARSRLVSKLKREVAAKEFSSAKYHNAVLNKIEHKGNKEWSAVGGKEAISPESKSDLVGEEMRFLEEAEEEVEENDEEEDEDDDWDDDEFEDDDDSEVEEKDASPIKNQPALQGEVLIVEGSDKDDLAAALKQVGATNEDIEEILEEEAAFEKLENEIEHAMDADSGTPNEAEAEEAGWKTGTDKAAKAMTQKESDANKGKVAADVDNLEEGDTMKMDEESRGVDESDEDKEQDEDEHDEDEDGDDDEDEDDEDEDQDQDGEEVENENEIEDEDKEGEHKNGLDNTVEAEGIINDRKEDKKGVSEFKDGQASMATDKSSTIAGRLVDQSYTQQDSASTSTLAASGETKLDKTHGAGRNNFWIVSGIGGVVLVAALLISRNRRRFSNGNNMLNTTAFGSNVNHDPFGMDANSSVTQHYDQYRRVTTHDSRAA